MASVDEKAVWEGFRVSVVRAVRRADADDPRLEICGYCNTEVDVDEPVHSPKCKSPAQVALREGRVPMFVGPGRDHDYSLDALERMDAGLPQRPALEPVAVDDEEDELELDEEAPASDASSSSPKLEDERAAAVGHAAASGTADSPGELERAAANSTNPYGLQKMGRGYIWTKDAASRAVQAFVDEHGHPPSITDAKNMTVGSLPGSGSAKELYGSWADMIEQLGHPRPTRGTSYRTTSRREPSAVPSARTDRVAAAPTGEQPSRLGWIKVPGTGLAYRNPLEAYVAADEIEADGERVAQACRDDGDDERADLAVDQARELADKIRAAARAADESGTAEADHQPEPEPETAVPLSGEPSSTTGAPPPPPSGSGITELRPIDQLAPLTLNEALGGFVRAIRDVLDAVERELSIEGDAGAVARVIVDRIGA